MRFKYEQYVNVHVDFQYTSEYLKNLTFHRWPEGSVVTLRACGINTCEYISIYLPYQGSLQA